MPLVAQAQFVPPTSAYQWSGNANSSTWTTGGNWVGGSAPSLNADVLFGNLPSAGPEVAVNVNGGTKTLRALWFDAGKWYNLSGAAMILGGGTANDAPVITVNASGETSEVNIDNALTFNFGNISGTNRRLHITNNSEGGLRLGGTVNLGAYTNGYLRFLTVGGKATHFANSISGYGVIQTSQAEVTTHLVLSGNNNNWRGLVGISPESLGFIKRNAALPGIGFLNSGSFRASVVSGGTLGFRSHVYNPQVGHNGLNYTNAHSIFVQGPGAIRQPGVPAVGAVYNDGGKNTFAGDIQMSGDTWFGSRGDRNGGLTLTGQITGGGYSFTKVGPGLITLTNTSNTWGTTHLNAGVLRIPALNALPTHTKSVAGNSLLTHQLVFNGGILEYANSDTLYHYYFLGNGTGQTNWVGSGGFSASGSAHFVQIVSQTQPYVPELQWGQNGFVPIGKELLLSSRYANAPIFLSNGIAAGGATIRVERGLTADALAGIVGPLGGASKADFTKTGAGLLWLNNTTSNYVGQTRITDGALGGFIPMTSNIALRGGVIMLGNFGNTNPTTFTRNVGTGVGQIQWMTTIWGGFAAWSGDQTVRLNNSTSLINWDSLYFVQTGASLKFGHYTSSGTVIWDKILGLGSVARSIYVERGRDLTRADVVFNQQIIAPDGGLSIIGDGRMDIQVNNPSLNSISIYGAELRLHSGGRIGSENLVLPPPNHSLAGLINQYSYFSIHFGGKLTLDNRGNSSSENGGFHTEDRAPPTISLRSGGSFRLWGKTDGGLVRESMQHISLHGGPNNIDLRNFASNGHTQLVLKHLLDARSDNYIGEILGYNPGGIPIKQVEIGWGTLNLTSNVDYVAGESNGSVSIRIDEWGEIISGYLSPGSMDPAKWFYARYGINDDKEGDKIIPWATVNGRDWITERKGDGNYTYLVALPQYYTNMNPGTWDLSHNLSINNTNVILPLNKSINSLRLYGVSAQAGLDLNNATLSLESGGLLSYGVNQITGRGTIQGGVGGTAIKMQRPFYAHIYDGELRLEGGVRINSRTLFEKVGNGTLRLNSNATHRFEKGLFIYEGKVHLSSGKIQAEFINVSDGAGVDILELPANSWNSIIGISGLPNMNLIGSQYRANDEAILRMGGNTKLKLGVLFIGGLSVIDWQGGEVGKANILWIEELTFDFNSKLYMRNWYEYEDILLVRKGGINPRAAPQFIFEGYEEFPVLFVDWDKDYWQVTPFYRNPEPETYGAILGAVGLGLVIWRKRRRKTSVGQKHPIVS